MKNIHIIPTDQPSRLHKIGNRLHLDTIPKDYYKKYNIYITSDEGITGLENNILVILGDRVFIWENTMALRSNNKPKRIILTTDPTLIRDGVQEIEDEFLEWFVKNPTCEFVKVIRNKKLSDKNIFDAKKGDLVFNNHGCGGTIQELSNDIRVHIVSENGEGYIETAITADNGIDTLIINNYKVYEYSDYKIIIPQEEPKQETLEEAAKNYGWRIMYSEEEVEQIAKDAYAMGRNNILIGAFNKWFEQVKKTR